MPSRLLVLLVASLAFVAPACGGGGGITIGEPSDSGPVTTAADAETPAPGTEVGDCFEVTEAFTGLAAEVGGTTPAEGAAAVEQMKSVFPADLADEIQTMVDAYTAGPAEQAQQLSSPEFVAATTAVTDHLAAICGGG